MTVALVWFRRNLRLADNAPLTAALDSADAVVPVYVQREVGAAHGPGAAAHAWIDRSLASLDAEARKRGSALVMRVGMPAAVIARLAEETGAASVHCERDWSPDGLAEETGVREVLAAHRVSLHVCEGQLLVTPPQLRTGSGTAYSVFTPFYRAWRRAWEPRGALPEPTCLPAPARLPATAGPLSPPSGSPDIGRWWLPGERAARARLATFCDERLSAYDAERDAPALRATSELSASLACGEISVAEVATSALGAGGSAAEAFIRQLAWREFSYHVLHDHPAMAETPLRPEFSAFPWSATAEQVQAWRTGRTGYPLVDAGMRQLEATGWMHNRVRLVAASLLTKDLLGDWRVGEEHFRQRLADYDPAANAFNWQWVAGSGADAAPYFRIFNPSVQGARFDAAGAYVRAWVPELAGLESRWIHRPWEAPREVLGAAGVVLGETYPLPIVDHAQARYRALAAYAALKSQS